MKNICILGCGYIGCAAAKLWAKNHHITATTRHVKRLENLSKIAQKCVIFKGGHPEELISLITNNEILLVTMAPDNIDQYADTYLKNAQLIRQVALELHQPRHLIYTSSTSVYGDHQGLWVDETSSLLGHSEPAKILIETEALYHSLQEFGWDVTIFRLAEIYGPERELSRKLSHLCGAKMAGNGALYTNMIHKDDIVKALDFSLRHPLKGVFNLADEDHPLRKDLYHEIAKKHHLTPVEWDLNQNALRGDNKRVSNRKIKSIGFIFDHPHRILD